MTERQKNHAAVPFLMTGLAFLAFLIVYAFLVFGTVVPLWRSGLLFLFPAGILLLFACLTKRGVLSDRAGTVLSLVTGILMALLCAVLFLFLSLQSALSTVTDPVYYERALKHGGIPEELLLPFPDALPDQTEVLSFRYQPQVLQGAGELLLVRSSSEIPDSPFVWLGTREDLALQNDYAQLIPEELFQWVSSDAVLTICSLSPDASYNHGRLSLILTDGSVTVSYASVW